MMIPMDRWMLSNLTVSKVLADLFDPCYYSYCNRFVVGESDHDASLSEGDDDKIYDSDELDEEVEKLKTSDPEFYKYLKECDKNLAKMSQSNDDDDDVDNDDDDDDYDEDDVEGVKSEKLHKPPVNLEVSSFVKH